ncbi:Histone-lysine N-methyltransferase, H3 lysine-4 specific isoform A [Micractinium conductrix]|uniref:[histone H3]-lysine(4) N-trimethyltransferase n=1 Tax=Micractinium conductrix TaxID=554055 RepID=A0A2P6VMF6_9CHLO|nr:Histone-lysine N-methyltransferase, H3 lysine-4 specific isoform A [Micractinium conductrix]|eukprot:PSC75269.1 Histone-lysine N-methyltransferase, H3 lysine-4 specific isoform A [Micractinium conductrix]
MNERRGVAPPAPPPAQQEQAAAPPSVQPCRRRGGGTQRPGAAAAAGKPRKGPNPKATLWVQQSFWAEGGNWQDLSEQGEARSARAGGSARAFAAAGGVAAAAVMGVQQGEPSVALQREAPQPDAGGTPAAQPEHPEVEGARGKRARRRQPARDGGSGEARPAGAAAAEQFMEAGVRRRQTTRKQAAAAATERLQLASQDALQPAGEETAAGMAPATQQQQVEEGAAAPSAAAPSTARGAAAAPTAAQSEPGSSLLGGDSPSAAMRRIGDLLSGGMGWHEAAPLGSDSTAVLAGGPTRGPDEVPWPAAVGRPAAAAAAAAAGSWAAAATAAAGSPPAIKHQQVAKLPPSPRFALQWMLRAGGMPPAEAAAQAAAPSGPEPLARPASPPPSPTPTPAHGQQASGLEDAQSCMAPADGGDAGLAAALAAVNSGDAAAVLAQIEAGSADRAVVMQLVQRVLEEIAMLRQLAAQQQGAQQQAQQPAAAQPARPPTDEEGQQQQEQVPAAMQPAQPPAEERKQQHQQHKQAPGAESQQLQTGASQVEEEQHAGAAALPPEPGPEPQLPPHACARTLSLDTWRDHKAALHAWQQRKRAREEAEAQLAAPKRRRQRAPSPKPNPQTMPPVLPNSEAAEIRAQHELLAAAAAGRSLSRRAAAPRAAASKAAALLTDNATEKQADMGTLRATAPFLKQHRSRTHGWGLFAGQPIKRDSFVIEYVGQVVSNAVADRRERVYEAQGLFYMFRLDKQQVIDATRAGNAARYINHSCEPNCYTWVLVDMYTGKKSIGIFARRDVAEGEELSYDYKMEREPDGAPIPCNCGARCCAKRMN